MQNNPDNNTNNTKPKDLKFFRVEDETFKILAECREKLYKQNSSAYLLVDLIIQARDFGMYDKLLEHNTEIGAMLALLKLMKVSSGECEPDNLHISKT